MTSNPEFDTRPWPTVNANGMKSRSKFNKRHFGGFGARAVQDVIAAGKLKKLLLNTTGCSKLFEHASGKLTV